MKEWVLGTHRVLALVLSPKGKNSFKKLIIPHNIKVAIYSGHKTNVNVIYALNIMTNTQL